MPKIHQILVSPLVGGAGVIGIRLAVAARLRGLQCLAWIPNRGPASDALDREQVRWRCYDLDAMRSSNARQLLACARMIPVLSSFRPAVVHVHNPTVYRLLRPALLAARARVVVHFQIEPTADEILWALKDPPNHVVACAAYIAENIAAVMAQHGRRVRVSSVPNAVDTSRFAPGPSGMARHNVGLPTQNFVVLVMANLAPHKGQHTAIRATAALKSRGIPIECWLAGEDRSGSHAFENELRSLSAECGVSERVRFLGFRSDAPDLLRAADVLLLPSTHEGLPLTVLEAQAAGVPVVGSSIPGIREIVDDGVTGFTVPAADYIGYADRIQLLLEDQAVRGRLIATAARKVTTEHTWANLEARMFEIYESLMPQGGRVS